MGEGACEIWIQKSLRHVNRRVDAIKQSTSLLAQNRAEMIRQGQQKKKGRARSNHIKVHDSRGLLQTTRNRHIYWSICIFADHHADLHRLGYHQKGQKKSIKKLGKNTAILRYGKNTAPISFLAAAFRIPNLVGKMTPVFLAQNCPTMVQSKKGTILTLSSS